MTRHKSMAPPPPPADKKPRLMSASEASDPETVSLLMMFDDLIRNEKVLTSGDGDEKFLQFATNQELCRRRWEAAESETQRLAIELQKSEQEVRKLEMKLNQARDLLASETSLRKKAENDRDAMGQKWEMVREVIADGGQTMNDDTRLRLAKLEASVSTSRRWSNAAGNIFSPGAGVGLSPVSERDSMGSILDVSDLSFDATQDVTRDAADETRLRSGKNYKRKSSGGVAQLNRRSRSKGGAHARKSLEALAARKSGAGILEEQNRNKRKSHFEERNIDDYMPSAPVEEDDAIVAWNNARNAMTPSVSAVTVIERQRQSTATLTPNHPSTATLVPTTPGNPVMRSYSNAGMNRKHHFVQKTEYKRATCGVCNKRVKFGKIVYKCRECGAVCHPECKDQVPLPCVPTGSAQKTPSKAAMARGGQLADYTPHSSPMVPALIVHCINEIEARGLCEVGLYRIPGSEKEVRDLREKFLAGRGCPNLSQCDVHALTGLVKDFLKSLREPLIPHSQWTVFTQAATNPDVTDGMSELFQAISEMPQPNRDTLAFLMLHFQKVSESKETKMTISNLARTIGITVVGYSCTDPSADEIMRATQYQTATTEKLIQIDSDYWSTFISGNQGEDLYRDTRILSPGTPDTIFKQLDSVTPMRMSMRSGKVYESRAVPQATTGKIFSSPVLL